MKKITLLASILYAGFSYGQIQFNTIDVAVTENFNNYRADGFTPTPSATQLHSDNWSIKGFSDGIMNFGDTKTTGDFTSSSYITTSTAGLVAFQASFDNTDYNFGISPTSTEFDDGYVILRVKNNTGKTLTSIDLAYNFEYLNNNPRTHTFDFSYSSDDINYTAVPALNDATPGTPDGTAFWQSKKKTTTITGLSIPCGSYIYLKWSSVNTGANGSDEIGLDDLSITPHGTVSSTCTPGGGVNPPPGGGSGIGSHGGTFDDFTDGNFSASPVWGGNTTDFAVNGGSLQLNAAAAGTSYLSAPSTAICNATWEFTTKLDFSTSSTSYTDVYLASDIANLTGSVNGYMVRIGHTADAIKLYKVTNGTASTTIIATADKAIDTNPVLVRVKVTTDNSGNWTLYYNTDNSTTYTNVGTGNDVTYTSSAYFGVVATYTSTRTTAIYYDDINISGNACTPTGVAESASLDNIQVYTTGTGVFTLNKTVDNVLVYNLLGNVVYSGKHVNSINLANQAPGSYFARIEKDGKVSMIRLNK